MIGVQVRILSVLSGIFWLIVTIDLFFLFHFQTRAKFKKESIGYLYTLIGRDLSQRQIFEPQNICNM